MQEHIAAFGGDPTKVTLFVISLSILSFNSGGKLLTTIKLRWGQSAGGISVGSQIVTNRGDSGGLFRGAIMQSGSPQTAMDTSSGQQHYDRLVNDTGCAGAGDTLDCLRNVPYEKLKQGVEDLSPGMFTYRVGHTLSPAITVANERTTGTVVDLAYHCRWRFLIRYPTPLGSERERGPSTGPHRYEVSGKECLYASYFQSPQVTSMTKGRYLLWGSPTSRTNIYPHITAHIDCISLSGRTRKLGNTFARSTWKAYRM